ncbi:putative phosphoglycerate mutase, partial [Globisporangium splendens]
MTTIRALPGYFARVTEGDGANAASSLPPLFKKFRLATSSWAALDAKLTEARAADRDVKVVYLVRHAEGIHNAAEREFGTDVWEKEYAKTEAYLDADLTEFGCKDALEKGPPALDAERAKGMPTIERVVVSTLSRAIHTAQLFFSKYDVRSPQFVSMELCREIMGVHTCDKRVSLTQLKKKFPGVDFAFKGAAVLDEDDVLWSPTHRETDAEIQARAMRFLNQFFHAIPDKYVAVVAHSKFIRSLYEVLLPHEADVFPSNCEVIPIVLERA